MTLYIHFGIYKAGSSYIQYICANQRDYLASNGIYFPESVEDQKMQAGLISKGNADGLEKAIKTENTSKISSILKKWYDTANTKQATGVLISAEALVHQLAVKQRLELLITCIKNTGFIEIEAMGFFRDLADHALSTYKHRAKTGKHPDYEYWVKHNYETPELFKNLAQTIKVTDKKIHWSLRKFQKNSEFLKRAFFKEWLGIELPDFKEKPTVNESLTLSEVKLMNHLKRAYPLGIDYFVDGLKALPKSKKAKDRELEQFILNKFIEVLQIEDEIFDKINTFFFENERLQVYNQMPLQAPTTEPYIQLTEEQLKIVRDNMLFFNSFAGAKVLWLRRLYRFLR